MTKKKLRCTVEDVMSWEPCEGYDEERVRRLFGRRKYLTALQILDLDIPYEDRLWSVLREELVNARTMHLLDCWVAEWVLTRERKEGREPDPRSWDAPAVKRRWLDGKATDEELSAVESAARSAESAAWSAAESAEPAAWSAGSAAWSAAKSATVSARSAAESAAWSAARSAARSAWSSAWSAAESSAESAARSAESAAWSAESAARSAESAVESAARSAESARSAAKHAFIRKLKRMLEGE